MTIRSSPLFSSVLRIGVIYGLLVGIVGWLQVAAVTGFMLIHRDELVSYARTTAQYDALLRQYCPSYFASGSVEVITPDESQRCDDLIQSSFHRPHPHAAEELTLWIHWGYFFSIFIAVILYFMAGRRAAKVISTGGMGSFASVGAASLAALTGGILYALAVGVRALTFVDPLAAAFLEAPMAPTYPDHTRLHPSIVGAFLLDSHPLMALLVVAVVCGALSSSRTRRLRNITAVSP